MIKRNKARLARYYRVGLIALLLLGLMAWAWIPGVAVVSFFLMILQAIVAPLPAFVKRLPMPRCLAHFGAAYYPGAAQWQVRRCAFLLPAF